MACATPKFTSPEEAAQRGEDFFKWCDAQEPKQFPTVAGFAVFCGASVQTIWNYENRPEYSAVMTAIKDRIYNSKIQAGLRGEANTTLIIFDAVNNHNMINTRSENKNDMKLSGSVTVEQALTQAINQEQGED